MRLRPLAVMPIAVVGVALALSASLNASAEPASRKTTPAQTKTASGPKKSHRGNKHSHKVATLGDSAAPHPTLATAVRNWGDYDVVEGQIGQAMPGAECPAEMANIDDRFCIDRWEDSLEIG